ncbi:hypothetical protein ABIB57_004221 [Devosia sp. UYZn731]|uniref:hypothetical protein n=1 Tax=Devosia sp. UYZn731 TaxID=3156345 RepID=UPI0033967378
MHKINVVSYKTLPGAAADNLALIGSVLAELHEERPDGINYMVIALDDGGFLHIVDESAAPRPISEFPAFSKFANEGKALRETGPEFRSAKIVGRYGFDQTGSE